MKALCRIGRLFQLRSFVSFETKDTYFCFYNQILLEKFVRLTARQRADTIEACEESVKPFILMLIVQTYCFAQEISREVWSYKHHHFLMVSLEKGKILISENCLDQNQTLLKSNCEAAKILKQTLSISLRSKDFNGGKNPGAVICKNYLKQNIVILKDPDQNENSFCQFEDRSLISAISLMTLVKGQ